MKKAMCNALSAWVIILVLLGNSALAQNLSWGGVSNLSAAGQSAGSSQIALSSDGTKATAVWRPSDGGGSNQIVQSKSASISGNTATWSSVAELSVTGQEAEQPQIALSSDGTKATAVWYISDGEGSNHIVQSKSASIRGNTATWSSVTDLLATGQYANSPQIALSSDGTKATAVWSSSSDGFIQSASAIISGNTATWSSVTDLLATGQTANSPKIALSSDGTKATAVWYGWVGSNIIIQSASATISGNTATWSSATELSVTRYAGNPNIALSSDGTKATAVWRHEEGSNYIIQSKSASISGNTATWSSVTELSATGEHAGSPHIALSSDGTKATTVWYRHDGSNIIIQSASATVSGNTATWSSATDLSATGQSAGSPQIAISSDGTKATAVWYSRDGSNYIIQSASATVSGNTATWSSMACLLATGQRAFYPHIALSSDGTKATAVWERSDGSNFIIQSKSASEDSSCFVIKSKAGKTAIFCL